MWLLFVVSASVFGMAAVSATQVLKEKVALTAVGVIAGLTMSITITYVVSLVVALTPLLLLAETIVLAAAAAGIFFRTDAFKYWKKLPLDTTALVAAGVLLAFSVLISSKILMSRPDGIYTSVLNTYGDVAWHMANIVAFAEGQSLPPENPIFSGTRLTYPFLSNFFSAMLLVDGGSFTQVVAWPAMLLIPLALTLFYCLARDYARSKTAAVFALILFMLGGAAFGWTRFGQLYQESGQPFFEFLTHLPAGDFSGNTDPGEFNFLNPLLSLLIPQRSFLFGMPIAFAILLLLRPQKNKTGYSSIPAASGGVFASSAGAVLLEEEAASAASSERLPYHPATGGAVFTATNKSELQYLLAGVLAGLLPLFHAHTILALIPAIVALFILQPGTQWLLFTLSAFMIGIPELLYYLRGQHGEGSFFRYEPGWHSGQANFVWYWFINTGLLIPVTVLGLFLKEAPRLLKALALAGAAILVIGNIFVFAPWVWDNFKLLIFWLIFSVPLIGWVLAYAIKERKLPYAAAFVAAFLILHTLSAGLDFWKLSLPTAPRWQEWDLAGIAIAKQIEQLTEPGESVLTAPYHNSPVVLAGRPRYLGYPGHVWSHGGIQDRREKAIGQYFTGTIEVLPEDPPQYVLIGPVERTQYPDLVIRPTWSLLAQEGEYQLYAIAR